MSMVVQEAEIQNSFHSYARPLSFLPRSFGILRIFLISAIYHMLVYHPHHRVYLAGPMFTMFLLIGVGLESERQYKRLTGKRVEGWAGRAWCWAWCLFCGSFMMRGLAEVGWLGGIRRTLAEDRTSSAVEWVLSAAGKRPHPFLPLPGRRTAHDGAGRRSVDQVVGNMS